MQNEELRRAERELEPPATSMPTCIILRQSVILRLMSRYDMRNKSERATLELSKRLLLNKSFTSFLLDMSDQQIFRAHCDDAFLKQTRQSCEAG